jgi:hypothetical protein
MTHRLAHSFVVIWCIIWGFITKIKACNYLICRILSVFDIVICGEGGIQTPGTCYSTPDFESGTFNHSDTSPYRGYITPQFILFGRPVIFLRRRRLRTYLFILLISNKLCDNMKLTHRTTHQYFIAFFRAANLI